MFISELLPNSLPYIYLGMFAKELMPFQELNNFFYSARSTISRLAHLYVNIGKIIPFLELFVLIKHLQALDCISSNLYSNLLMQGEA